MVFASLGLVYATELLLRTLRLLSMHSTSCPACMEKTWQTHTNFALVGQSKHQTLQQDAAVQNISPKPLETWSSYRNNFPRECFKSKAAFLLPGGDGLSGRGFQRERESCSLSRCWGTELGPWTSHEKAGAKTHSEEHAFGKCQWTSVNEEGRMESEPPPAVAPWLWEIPWSFLSCAMAQLEASGDLSLLPGSLALLPRSLALLPGNRAFLNHTAASTPSTHIISFLCQEQGPSNPHTCIMDPFFAVFCGVKKNKVTSVFPYPWEKDIN